MMDLSLYRARGKQFEHDYYLDYFLTAAGHKPDYAFEQIYSHFSDLGAVETVKTLLATRTDKAAEHLANFAVTQYFDTVASAETQAYETALAENTEDWDGEAISYHDIRPMLANEPDANRRRALYAVRGRLIAKAEPYFQALWTRWHALARELGFSSYTDLWSELRWLNLDVLAAECRAFMEATQTVFHDDLRWWAAECGITDVQHADFYYLLRAAALDGYFPTARMVDSLRDTASTLGIALDSHPGLVMDLDERPGKTTRPFCCPIAPPHDVRLSLQPQGGVQDYKSLFHEAGHALHWLHFPDDLPFEYGCNAGEFSVGELYSFHFEHLIEHPAWLAQYMGIAPDERMQRYHRLDRLYNTRGFAASVLYEVEFHRGLDNAPERFSAIFSQAYTVDVPPYEWLYLDPHFYSAQYTRALLLEHLLDAKLARDFGRAWWNHADAGATMRALWSHGCGDHAEDLALAFGFDGLTAQPAADFFNGPLNIATGARA